MSKAYALRDRVSKVEKFRITAFYYFDTTELDKYIETFRNSISRLIHEMTDLTLTFQSFTIKIGQWEKSARSS